MNTRVATLLLAGAVGVSVHAQVPDFTPPTPLISALLHNDPSEARRLIDRGADPNEGRFVGFPPVFLAIQRQDIGLLHAMASNGADLNARDSSGSTALMWAAANESGDATIVNELLRLGADPHATNKVGESALDWAMRRGDTPAVAALRHAGASDAPRVRTSVAKALALLQRSGAQFTRVSGCYSCHHSSLPQMALGVARSRGFQVDEAAVREQVDVTIALVKNVANEALANRDRIPDPPIALSYGLLGMAASHYARNEVTDVMTSVISAWQGSDGAFHTLPPIRPPIESSDFTATALSLRAIQLYGSNPDARVARASHWLRTAAPRSTEERAMQLLGLAWANAPADDIRISVAALLAMQHDDGGWAQLPNLETDAYATGQALVALQTAGYPVSSAEYDRGKAFLLRTQFPDGSWLVRTRTFPVQPPRDTGFPHGKHQWISAAGTSWAAMALAYALPELPPGGSR
jgi:hypothetical protein